MKLKSKLFIFLSFLLPIFLIGTAFSDFFFAQDKWDEHIDDTKGMMDDIDSNYSLDANAYTIYFFSSPFWASYIKATRTSSTSLSDLLSVEKYKTWMYNNKAATTDTALKKYGYFTDTSSTTDMFGYKRYYADTCVSSETFNSVNTPTSTARDSKNYKALFNGWTASISSAQSAGYISQGNYNYVSAYDELALMDNEDNDANSTADKVVFLYPVYTAGKAYGSKAQTPVRLHGRVPVLLRDDDGNLLDYFGQTNPTVSTQGVYFKREMYFSQEDYSTAASTNIGFYFYNNLKVEKNEQLYLDADINWSGTWRNFKDGYGSRWEGNWDWETEEEKNTYGGTGDRKDLTPLFDTTGTNSKEAGTCAVDEEGIYNVYVWLTPSSGTRSNSFEAITTDSYTLVYCQDPKDGTSNITYFNGTYMYVKIEKILDIGLAGGATKSMEHDVSHHMNKSNKITTTTTTARYYIVNNIFMEGTDIGDTITSYCSTDGSEYKYPSYASSITRETNKPFSMTLMSDSTELANFNTNYASVYGTTKYKFSTSSDIFELASVDSITTDKDNPGTVKNLPLINYSSSDMIFIKPKKSGFYSFVAKISAASTRTTTSGLFYCTISLSSCEVALALGENVYSNVYLYKEGASINKKSTDSKFIDIDKSTGNYYASVQMEYGKALTYDTEFTLREAEGTVTTKTLGTILGVSGTTASKHLTNHLTGREFRFTLDDDGNYKSIKLKRNYAFYIMDGTWKEGEITLS